MPIKQSLSELLCGEIKSKEVIDVIFDELENQLLDKREITVNLKKVTFVSVYFLERLERFMEKAKDLSVEIKIINISPEIYKVFQVSRLNTVLNACLSP